MNLGRVLEIRFSAGDFKFLPSRQFAYRPGISSLHPFIYTRPVGVVDEGAGRCDLDVGKM